MKKSKMKTGNFDLNFFGAHIICDTIEKREAFLAFFRGNTDNIELPLSFSNKEYDLEKAIFNTTYVHEGKHLHDHLLCSQLVHNYILKLSALCYSTLAIYECNNGNKPYKYIPTPFSSWIELPNNKKMELLEEYDIKPSEVPMFSLKDASNALGENVKYDRFTKFILLAALHYSEYRYNINQLALDGYNGELSIRSFAESSAYVQHITEIVLKYGNYGDSLQQQILNDSFKCFQELGKQQRDDNILVHPNDYIGYCKYTFAFTMIWRYAFQSNINIEYIYPFISYVLFWALNGNVLEGKKEANFPRNRLERFFNLDYMGIDLELNRESNIQELFNNPLETFKKWDYYITTAYAGIGVYSLSQSSNFYLDSNSTPINLEGFYNKLLGTIDTMIQYLISLGLFKTAKYMYNIANSCFFMKNHFIDNPSAYLKPTSYSQNLHQFVNVPFCVEFDGIPPINEVECGRVRHDLGFVQNKVYGNSLNDISHNENVPRLDWRTYIDSKNYIDFSDALLGKSNIDVPGNLIKELLPGIKPWFF